MHVAGIHDPWLVAISILIAALASYAALDLASRIRATSGWASHAWLGTAAIALGGGIWAMHFIAMLAFSIPGIAVRFDLGLTVFSFVLPIMVTGLGFLIVHRPGSGPSALISSGLVMGLGIAAMHYTGMAAMEMDARLSYHPWWAALSVLIAIAAATVALWLALKNTGVVQKIVAAVVMGFAIAGMHYTAMLAASFTAGHAPYEGYDHASIGQTGLAVAIAAATFLILALALIAAMFDRRFAVLAEKEAEALRRSEERFRSLYRRTPLPLHALDREGRIEQVSDAWIDLLGYPREAVIGRPLTEFMTEASAQTRAQSEWPKLVTDGLLQDAEHRLATSAGVILDVLVSERVELDEQGDFRRVLGGLVDVTARRQAEEALRQSQKIEAIGQLTGGVAHDFNNLLAVVIGNLDLLQKRMPADPKLVRLVENALQGAQRGAALTQRMLSFARRQDLRPEAVDVPALVRGMQDLLQRSLGPQTQIETRFPLGSVCARADANQLEMALLNLVVNARDAMPEGGTISIGLRQAVGGWASGGTLPGEYLCLSVSDTGEGMDEATLARAREPFFTTKGVGKGTGLGISMVHGFAEQSGGKLVLKSRKGEGTTAEIWLPVAASMTQQAVSETVVSPPSGDHALHLLVVDDDALVRMNTAMMLEDLGHTVVEASSGQEALTALEDDKFDLLITDQAMPKMTGVQLASAVRTTHPDLPILVATGYAELPTNVNLPRLSKPFNQTALARAIADAMTKGC
ncbi:chemotaxis protein CheY [Bosea sp. AAP35]|uniref:MHYT domain-containing protein n=1 Tax=Bosea sp. AAP35 TaxID=1523417 RepID=UPI0006B8DD87|nr:MHYT domain-containing protein [Bosea sp. AAP35]KPF68324.1 chemotaxis protein CheY [Bosea sp. AAP35]